MRKNSFISLVFLSAGLAISGMAVFADALGLDQDSGWGRARIALLLFGVFIALTAVFLYFYAGKLTSAAHKVYSFFKTYADDGQNAVYLFSKHWVALPCITAVILVYIWFISSGTWTTWVSPTRYYADLARGFQKGHLYTLSKTPPELSALPDPYDYKARDKAGIRTPIDISYYKGRYYLYWGPVPALLLAALSPFYSGRVGDLQLVFVFVCGIFLIQSLFITLVWDRFFRHLPRWMLAVSILVTGLGSPVTFMLANFSGARIYEAAVSGAQFFLMGGFLAAFTCLRDLRIWKLALAGFLWALAIGTRQTVLLAVGFMTLTLAYVVLNGDKPFFQKFKEMTALILPLVIGIACLGWYNWARFGSVTETGLYYQMNYGFVHYHTAELAGYKYIFQNLYNYLFMPFGVNAEFPFLHPELGSREEILFFSKTPSIYNSQVITGLLCSVPFMLFSSIPFAMLLVNRASALKGDGRMLYWVGITLGGASLASFSFLLVFFWAAMRYAYDFTPSLIVLSVIGFWQGYAFLVDKPAARRLYTVLGIVLAGVSIVVSTLLAISINDARFILIQFFSSL